MATAPPHSPPRKFPTSGFVALDTSKKIEEEEIPSYVPDDYYPVYIGELFRSRYQVVTKLGFGVNSTVWLCRDLWEYRYVTLKVRVRAKEHDPQSGDPEITINEHLRNNPIDHMGKDLVRRVLDSFEITSPNGNHKFPKDLSRKSVQLVLIGLDYLHQCCVVHTDISPNNVLQKFEDESVLSQIEQDELKRPVARKILSDRTIYISRPMPLSTGIPILCDFGEARIGTQKHRGDIMPGIYRAPEVILDMEWDCKVDIWAIGIMMWDLLEGGHLFFAKKSRILDDEQHLAEMVSLLGLPPAKFLQRSEKCSQYWDSEGNWKGSVPIPDQTFEIRERVLSEQDRTAFLQFLRKMLRWMPEERLSAEELAFDDFLMEAQTIVSVK